MFAVRGEAQRVEVGRWLSLEFLMRVLGEQANLPRRHGSDDTYSDNTLEKYDMSESRGVSSLDLEKAEAPEDNELLSEDSWATFRSAVLTVLYPSNERSDITSMVQLLCTQLTTPDKKGGRQLTKLLRCNLGGATGLKPTAVGRSVSKVYTDNDWAQDPKSRTFASSAVILKEGWRIHAQPRGQAVTSLSSCEAGLYAAFGGFEEAVLIKAAIGLLQLESVKIQLMMDNSAARQVCHKRRVGKHKRLEMRALYLQEAVLR